MKKDIYWPDDGTWERVRHAAEIQGQSVSEYIRRATMRVVERDERKLPERAAQKTR